MCDEKDWATGGPGNVAGHHGMPESRNSPRRAQSVGQLRNRDAPRRERDVLQRLPRNVLHRRLPGRGRALVGDGAALLDRVAGRQRDRNDEMLPTAPGRSRACSESHR